MIKCEICGGTENVETFSSSLDFIRHNICRKCAEMSNEELEKLPKKVQLGVGMARFLIKMGNDDSDAD